MNSNAPTDTSSSPSAAVSSEAISRRAYELWEKAGRPDGNDMGHWLQAEKELNGDDNGNTEARRYTDQPQSRSTASDSRPLQGQGNRPAGSSNRDGKRTTSQNPFSGEKATAGAGASAGTATATKRRV